MLTDIKSILRGGNSLDSSIFMSDRTHLSNVAGVKKEWPVYMTIGKFHFEDPPDTLNAQRRNGSSPANSDHISKVYFSLWKTPGVSEMMWSVSLEASISGEYQTLGGHSGRPSA